FKTLQQCIDLLKSLPDDESFVFESKYIPSSTIGKHVRHICDHFRLLLDSRPIPVKRSFAEEYFITSDDNDNDSMNTLNDSSEWNVDYDNRTRKGAAETSRALAIKQIERLQSTIQEYSTIIPLNTPINMCTVADKDPMHVQSTYGRELWFCCHHAVHHYALIRVICIELKIPFPEDFGVAPSTLLYMEDKER
ncbi:9240_t:CDS:2, partial [Acaulospora morrowiae]